MHVDLLREPSDFEHAPSPESPILGPLCVQCAQQRSLSTVHDALQQHLHDFHSPEEPSERTTTAYMKDRGTSKAKKMRT